MHVRNWIAVITDWLMVFDAALLAWISAIPRARRRSRIGHSPAYRRPVAASYREPMGRDAQWARLMVVVEEARGALERMERANDQATRSILAAEYGVMGLHRQLSGRMRQTLTASSLVPSNRTEGLLLAA